MYFSAIKNWHSWMDLLYLCPLTLLEMTFNKGQVIVSHPELWGQQNVQVGHLWTLRWAYPSHEKSSDHCLMLYMIQHGLTQLYKDENTYRSVKPAVLTESSIIALHPAMALRNLYCPLGIVQHSKTDIKRTTAIHVLY